MEIPKKVLNHKKALLAIIIALVILLGIIWYISTDTKPELKAKEFEVEVNKDVSNKASTYLKNSKKNGEVVFGKSKIDNTKLGTYDVVFKYEGESYKISIKIVDKEKPIIEVDKKLFVFDLKTTVKDVNKEVNKHIKITDNYDKVFDSINVLDKVPTSEKELICNLKAKDTSNNVSDTIEIKIQFTKDGKEKSGLMQETKTIEATETKNEKSLSNGSTDKTSKNESDKTSTNNKEHNKSDEPKDKENSNTNKGDSSSSGNANNNTTNGNQSDNSTNSGNTNTGGNTNAPTEPSEPPRPSEQPKPETPVQKPQLTVANCPIWLSQGYEKLFANYDEAYNWWNMQVTTEGSPHYNEFGGGPNEISDNDYTGVIYGVFF